MTTSDIIEIISIIASAFTSFVAIGISVASLRQSNRVLKESLRPYITIYLDTITVCEQSSYFVLKNFGHTSAVITDFRYDFLLKNTSQPCSLLLEQFDSVKGIVLAPGQMKLLPYNVSTLPVRMLTFSICYRSGSEEYSESITMDVKNFIHLPAERPESFCAEKDKRMVQSLRELIERTM